MKPTVALIVAAALSLTGGTISPRIDDAKHLEYGAKFVHVAPLRCESPDSPTGVFAGSCVVISPNHILTAAHVVRNTTSWTVVPEDGRPRSLSRVTIHPDYGKEKGLNDLAVGFTEDKFSYRWYPAIYAKQDEAGKVAAIAGYGMTGNWRDGITGSDGNRRAGSNRIDFATGDYLICSVAGAPWTTLEFLICSGDSGGGLFLGNELAGINSCIMAKDKKPEAKEGEESVHVRLSEHRDWILGEVRCVE